MKSAAFFYERMGGVSMSAIIAIVFAVILSAALLPTGIGMWLDVTDTGGVGENWTAALKAIWDVAPIIIVVGVVAGFIVTSKR